MGISDILGRIYAGIEDKWYALLEALDSRGIPVHVYNNFWESKGLPSLPVTLALIILIFVAVFSLSPLGTSINPEISLRLQDNFDQSLSGVTLEILDAAGNSIKREIVSANQTLSLEGLKIGSTLLVRASKEGYESTEQEIVLESEQLSLRLTLNKILSYVDGKIKFVDSESGLPVSEVQAQFVVAEKTIDGILGTDNVFSFTGIPVGLQGFLITRANGYEQSSDPFVFDSEQITLFELKPSIISFQGKTQLLIVAKDKQTQQQLTAVKIKIFDGLTNDLISEVQDEDGSYTELLDTGTSVRITVEKLGYISTEISARTLRQEQEIVEAFLEQGGESIEVHLLDQGSVPLSDGIVKIYSLENTLLEEKTTDLSGTIEFRGLDQNTEYIVTGFKAGYLPEHKTIKPVDQPTVNLNLEPVHSRNSTLLNIFVLDSLLRPANNATIELLEIIDGKEWPAGYPSSVTDLTGYQQATVRLNTQIKAKARKDFEAGTGSTSIESGKRNEIKIQLIKPLTLVTLNLKDETGQIIDGNLVITAKDGTVLYTGPSNLGQVSFDGLGKENFILQATFLDGNTFSQEIQMNGRKTADITLSKSTAGLSPKIEFIGIEDEHGKIVEGISKEKFYWLKFKLEFSPTQLSSGAHFRIGDDSVKFADSQSSGILGFDSTASNFAYGRTYMATPEPGNEGLDRSNKGTANSYNKWLDLYFDKPNTVEIVRLKIRARETLQENEITVRYRAWSTLNGEFFREPLDSVLETANSNEHRSALYAEAKLAAIPLFEDTPECVNTVCFSSIFVDDQGNKFLEHEFNPLTNRTYALELTLKATQNARPIITVSTDKQNPKIGLNGRQIGQLSNVFSQEDSLDVEDRIDLLQLTQGEEKKIRITFRTKKAENTFLQIKVKVGETETEKTHFFTVYSEKEMDLKIVPEKIVIGQPFTIQVKDSESSEFVSNATVRILDGKKKSLRSVIGNNAGKKGRNGEYGFPAGLPAGVLIVEVTAPNYRKIEQSIFIGKTDVLTLQETTLFDLQPNKKTESKRINIQNKSSFKIKSLTVEVQESEFWPENLVLEAQIQSALSENETGSLNLNARFKGTNPEERLHGEAEVIVRGTVEDVFPVEIRTRVTVNYNKELPQDCLVFNTPQAQAFLLGLDNTSARVDIIVRNECSQALSFSTRIEGLEQDQQLTITAPSLSLQIGEEKSISLSLSNRIPRQGILQYPYRIFFNSPQMTASIPLFVRVVPPQFGLQAIAGNNGQVFLAKGENQTTGNLQERATGYLPLYIKNVGEFPINALQFTTVLAPGFSGSLDIDILPVESGGNALFATGYQSTQGTQPSYDNQTLYQRPEVLPYDTPQYGVPNNPLQNPMYALSQQPGFGGFNSSPTGGYNLGYNQGFGQTQFGNPNNSFSQLGSNNFTYFGSQKSLWQGMLMPGQQLNPPKTIYLSTAATKALEGKTIPARIIIWGSVNGRRIELTAVDLQVYISGGECLKVFEVEPLRFQSEVSSAGVLEKKIRIQNNCAEEVRELTLDRTLFGQNELKLEGASTVLNPGESQEYKLTLGKKSDYVSPGQRPEAISVKGFLVRSQQFSKSNKLLATILLGKELSEEGKATASFEMPICGDEKTTVSIKLPDIATQNEADCSAHYCDAKQMTQHVLGKINRLAGDVRRRLREISYDARNAGSCDPTQTFCSFSSLGISVPFLEVYLQNDVVTSELVKKILDDSTKFKEIKGYAVNTIEESAELITSSFSVHQIRVPRILAGCGRYRISLDGAVQNIGGKFSDEGLVFSFQLQDERKITAECTEQIQNVMNFLPKDEDLTLNTRSNTFLGTVAGDTPANTDAKQFEELKSSLAKSLFGKNEGRTGKSGNNNYLNLTVGPVEGSGVIKLKMEKVTDAEGNVKPVKIDAIINDIYVSSNPEFQKQLGTEIGKGIDSLAKGGLEGNGCMNADKTELVLRDLPTSARPQVNPSQPDPKAALALYSTETCLDMNVSSTIGERIILQTNWAQLVEDAKNGKISTAGFADITKVIRANAKTPVYLLANEEQTGIPGLNDIKKDEIIQEYSDDPTNKIEGTVIQLKQDPKNLTNYSFAVKLCAVGDVTQIKNALSTQLKVKARAKDKVTRESNEALIKLESCGLSPYDLVSRLIKLDVGSYYIPNVAWTGPDELSVDDILLEVVARRQEEGLNDPEKRKQADVFFGSTSATLAGQPEYYQEVRTAKKWALAGYTGTCAAVSIACNAISFRGGIGLGGLALSVAGDCGITAGSALFNMPGVDYSQTLKNLGDYVLPPYNLSQDITAYQNLPTPDPRQAVIDAANNNDTGIIGGRLEQALTSVTIGAFIGEYLQVSGKILTAGQVAEVTQLMTNNSIEAIGNRLYGAAPIPRPVNWGLIRNELHAILEHSIQERITALQRAKTIVTAQLLQTEFDAALTHAKADPALAQRFRTLYQEIGASNAALAPRYRAPGAGYAEELQKVEDAVIDARKGIRTQALTAAEAAAKSIGEKGIALEVTPAIGELLASGDAAAIAAQMGNPTVQTELTSIRHRIAESIWSSVEESGNLAGRIDDVTKTAFIANIEAELATPGVLTLNPGNLTVGDVIEKGSTSRTTQVGTKEVVKELEKRFTKEQLTETIERLAKESSHLTEKLEQASVDELKAIYDEIPGKLTITDTRSIGTGAPGRTRVINAILDNIHATNVQTRMEQTFGTNLLEELVEKSENQKLVKEVLQEVGSKETVNEIYHNFGTVTETRPNEVARKIHFKLDAVQIEQATKRALNLAPESPGNILLENAATTGRAKVKIGTAEINYSELANPAQREGEAAKQLLKDSEEFKAIIKEGIEGETVSFSRGRLARLGSVIRNMFTWEGAKGLGKGILCAGLANGAGNLAWDDLFKRNLTAGIGTQDFSGKDISDIDGDGKADVIPIPFGQILKNNCAHRVDISVGKAGDRKYIIQNLCNKPERPADIPEKNEIKAKCDASYLSEKPVIGNLRVPAPSENQGTDVFEFVGYQKYKSEIAKATEGKANVDDALIFAVMNVTTRIGFAQGDNKQLTGVDLIADYIGLCDTHDAVSVNNAEENIKCIAKRLNDWKALDQPYTDSSGINSPNFETALKNYYNGTSTGDYNGISARYLHKAIGTEKEFVSLVKQQYEKFSKFCIQNRAEVQIKALGISGLSTTKVKCKN